jgi:hypothetical protein
MAGMLSDEEVGRRTRGGFMVRYCMARSDNSTRLVLELQKSMWVNVRAGKFEPEELAKGRTHFLRFFTRNSKM